MGKIFGISDNPVSTIESALKGYSSVEPPIGVTKGMKKVVPDKFVSTTKNFNSKSKFTISKIIRKMLSCLK